MTTELLEQGNFWQKVVKNECKCTPHDYKTYELPLLHQYKLVCDRVLHWCRPILRIGVFGALTYVIVYPSIVH